MTIQTTELSYAVRLRTVGKYFGQLCLALALLIFVPLLVSLGLRDIDSSQRYVTITLSLGVAGFLLSRLKASPRLQTNEAMVIVALVYIAMPLLMTYPIMGTGVNFIDALFEAVSAGTTTGLSSLATIEDKPKIFLFARAWMQWYGGLGIVILSLAILIHPGLTAKTLAVTDDNEDNLAGGTKAHAQRVLLAYGSLTAIGIGILWLAGGDLFNAIVYTLSAVSTGGFSPHDSSLKGYGSLAVQWVVTLLCLAGSISLALYYTCCKKGFRLMYRDLQLRALLTAVLVITGLMVFCLRMQGMGWPEALHHGPLLALSAQSTAGFSTLDLSQLSPVSKGTLLLAMAVGGGVGSTAGGFKIFRLLILFSIFRLIIVRTCLPSHAVLAPYLRGQRLQDKEIREALGIILLFVIIMLFSWLPFLAMGYDPLNSLFEVVSATGTVGLSAGIIGPDLPVLLKAVLGIDMLMGRLEVVVWLVFFYPKTWLGRRAEV